MDNLETLPETSSKLSINALEQSQRSDGSASILIKESKSRYMDKSVSFSFMGDNKETMESIKTNISTESDSFKKTYFNLVSYNDNISKSSQSNNLSGNIPQPNSVISNKSTELENIIEQDEEPTSNNFGWDGYEARFERTSDHDSRESVPHCIPPWAKTMRKKYGVSPSSSHSHEYLSNDNINVKERIKNLMNKYSDLMLVKRVESKKQVIVEQGKYDDIDTVKARAKHTRYYIAPLSKGGVNKFEENDGDRSYNKLENDGDKSYSKLENSSIRSDNMSLTRKTSKTQAKREVHGIIQPAVKHVLEKYYGNTQTTNQSKCQKLTLNNIRDYVNAQSMTADQRKLHEIIKIEKVPSNCEMKEKAGSKYIINVPKNKPTDGATVNIIKIKEKRKLRVQSLEDVTEKTTELRYSEGSPQNQEKIKFNRLSHQENKDQTIGKTVKSPTETKTFQVTSKITPHIAPFVEENNTDKVLLIQYEKKSAKHKSKDSKYTTKLLGVRKPAADEREEMYLYETETCGEKQREYTTKVDGINPTLKEKLNLVFDELRGLAPKLGMLPETTCSDVQVRPDQSDHSSQRPSETMGMDVVSVQAMPEMKSVEVQVRESQILSSSLFISAPRPSPISGYTPDQLEGTDDRLQKTAKDLVTYAETQSDITDEKMIKKESFNAGEGKTTQFDEDKKTSEFDEGKSLEINQNDEKRQSKQSLSDQVTEIYKGTDDKKIYDEPTYIEQVKDDKDTTDILPLVKSVTFDETQDRIEELSIPSKGTDDGDKSGIIQETATDEVKYETTKMLSDLNRSDKPDDDEIFGEETSLGEPFKDQQTNDEKVITKFSKISLTSSQKENGEEYNLRKVKQSKEDLTDSHRESFDKVTVTDTLTIKLDDDIRSYNLEGYKDTELTFKSSSKFLHTRDSIRKRLNWSDDTLYLEKHLCPQLIRGLAETAVRRPPDPIAFLAHWIYKDYRNREQAEQEAVHQEHLQLERTMCDVQRPDALVHKKFNLKKYPVKKVPSIISERAPTLESFKDGIIHNEVTQES